MSARIASFVLTLCCAAILVVSSESLYAQGGGGQGGGGQGGGGQGGGGQGNNGNNAFGNNFIATGVVGGVKIDSSGVISGQKQLMDEALRQRLQAGLGQSNPDIDVATGLRMISLRGLEAAINKARDEGQPLSSELQFMAGLQRIEFVILSPETNDIIVAGPGEGWTIGADGNVVGKTSGTPVLQLEDFLVAMRSVENSRTGQGISVSIDPTEEGVRQLQRLYKALDVQKVSFGPELQPEVEKAMGQHLIKLTGVPEDSRFSQILVAADYKMKRLSMGIEKAPISHFPSFMEMAAAKNVKNMKAAPRFWMECNYEPVAQSEDGNVWQIRGSGVKTLTQESHFDKNGKKSTSGVQNQFALKWAEMMTERFEELASAEPAFRELRNVMDLSVIAAIINKEQLAEKVKLEMPAILGLNNISTPSWNVPKSVPTECSFVRISQSWLVSASGGIQLDPWRVASNQETVSGLAKLTAQTNPTADRWWWNAK